MQNHQSGIYRNSNYYNTNVTPVMKHFFEFGFLLVLLYCKLVQSELHWTHELKLGPMEALTVRWYITKSNTSDDSWIDFELQSPTNGYVAVGFSPQKGSMAGSDIYVGWVDKSGNGHIVDYFATGNSEPIQDRKQDAELIFASETPTGTTIRFRRRLDTCDLHDFVIADDTMHLMWAMNNEDPIEFNGVYRVQFHGVDPSNHGTRTTFLTTVGNERKLPDEKQMYPSGTNHFDIIVSNIRVPEVETYFHCKIIKFPLNALGKRIIGYRPLTFNGKMNDESLIVHQITLYKCLEDDGSNDMTRILERHVDHPGQDCYPPHGPAEWSTLCTEIQMTFGPNPLNEGIMFPEDLGQTISNSRGQYYKLEIHYENPNGNYMRDHSSGIRVFYTQLGENINQIPQQDKQEIGVLVTGFRRSPFLTIPPRQREFTVYGFCSSECFRTDNLDDSEGKGLKVVAVLLQSHLQARRIIVRHVRKGRELQPIVQENNAYYDYQQYRLLREEVSILPGDDLIIECTYNTMRNSTFIFGGLSARREICQATFIYYPKHPLIDCRSQPELYQYLGALGIMNVTGKLLKDLSLPLETIISYPRRRSLTEDSIVLEGGHVDQVQSDVFEHLVVTKPDNIRNRILHDHMMTLQWNDDFFVKLVEQKWRVGPHYMHCVAQDGKYLQNKMVIGFPKYSEFVGVIDDSMCMRQFQSTNFGGKSTTTKPIMEILLCTLLAYLIKYINYANI